MQDNQEDIAGDRPLSKLERKLLDDLAQIEARMVQTFRAIENLGAEHGDRDAGRWLSLARTTGEESFMWATRAITRPKDGLGRRHKA